MNNKKDIGKIFNEKLRALEKSPSDNVWNNISIELQKKRKRRIGFFFFWTKIIGFFIFGALTIWYVYRYQSNNSSFPNRSKENITVNENHPQTAQDQENVFPNDTSAKESNSALENDNIKNLNLNPTNNQNTINNKSTSNPILSEKTTVSKKSKFSKGKSGQYSTTKFKKTTRKKKTKFKTSDENISKKGDAILQRIIASPNLSLLQDGNKTEGKEHIPTTKKDSLVAQKNKDKVKNITMRPEDKKEKDSTKTYRKFDVDVFVSPTYYSYFAKKSTLDRDLDSLTKKTEISWSYGIGLSYQLTDQIAVRIGYTKTNLQYVTKNAPVNTPNYSGISYQSNITNNSIYTQSGNAEKMDISQKIAYTEIPLEVNYNISDNKLRLDGIAGFSYLALSENVVSITTDNGFSQEIGKSKYLSQMSFTVNLGVGLSYELFKNTKIVAEPRFNYQVKSFDNNNYKSYYFGIHTGIRYTFLNK
ncbi:outer membrane beta-barrel protein [Flavobacterium sedimenticola]|uniref:Outer membrane protein beta-barrel domain-containing protein n=1 Tax=Flavobacterium sedimenticola TaxID=3043286 RepID=A0ABT6XS84_9FLAO|nr:outer membrane beta-barrel protein [Flavobacterium sedimenticola]MDI9257835.1 hypothetical protein [Flavobacterium sedimenticola]